MIPYITIIYVNGFVSIECNIETASTNTYIHMLTFKSAQSDVSDGSDGHRRIVLNRMRSNKYIEEFAYDTRNRSYNIISKSSRWNK